MFVSGWKAPGVRYSIALNLLGGLIVGYAIGFIPILLQFNQYLGDCSRYTTPSACSALTDASCVWVLGNTSSGITPYCGFPDHERHNCSEFDNEPSCKAISKCFWRYHKMKCDHRVGWSADEQGIIAGAQIVGSMFSAPTGGPLTNFLGRKKSFGVCGFVTLLATALFTLGWSIKEDMIALVFAEFTVGLVSGWLSVICPMYCGEMAGQAFEYTIGVLFQVSLTFGIFLAGAMGFLLDPRDDTAVGAEHLQTRFQYVILVQWIIAFFMPIVACLMPESVLWENEKRTKAQKKLEQSDEVIVTGATNPDFESSGEIRKHVAAATPSYNLCKKHLIMPLLVGLALAAAQQLTGINAIMIYSPQLVGSIGMYPLVGNFYIMLWNFITCLTSIPLIRRFSPRILYTVTTGIATVAALITGIAVYPGVLETNGTAQYVLAGAGILVYVAAFESGIGPCFYVLSQDIFPEEARSVGCSYVIWICFVFNVVINWGFPVAKTAFSGGPSGDQDLGMSICFFIFAGMGFVTTLFMALKMPKSNSELRAEQGERRPLLVSGEEAH